MALKVTVTIKSGSGYGAPWHVMEGTPDELAKYLGIEDEDWDGKGSTLQSQIHKVAAWTGGDFAALNPGK